MRPGESLEGLTREQLLELIQAYSRNWLAMDGVWFQSIERKYGMDEAMYHDVEAWKRFTVTEARRIKKFLKLPERPGLEGLRQALSFRFYANLSHYEFEETPEGLLYRNLDCRVQQARLQKGLGLHPCKPAGKRSTPDLPGPLMTGFPAGVSAVARTSPMRAALARGCLRWSQTLLPAPPQVNHKQKTNKETRERPGESAGVFLWNLLEYRGTCRDGGTCPTV